MGGAALSDTPRSMHMSHESISTMTCTGHLEIKHTLWLFNIAMKNGPFIDGLPIRNCDFPRQTVKKPDGK